MTQITSDGFSMTRLDERYAQLVAAMQLIFGSDINTDPNSPDGQHIGIFAESVSNLDQLAEMVYQSLNPDTALGVALSRLVKLNGISRQPGSFSTASLTLTGTSGTLIPAGSLVNSADGTQTWQTLVDAILDLTGTAIVDAQCTIMGPFNAAIGTLTTIASPIFGWQTVTNPAVAIFGAYEETDEQLRRRRQLSTTATAVGPLDAIRGSLLNQVGVTQAMVYENITDAVDANGLPAHSINAVVQGGTNQTILDVIWFKKPAGVNVVGAVTGNVIDTAGFAHLMKFDRPTTNNIYLTLNIKKRAGYPATGATLIKNAIVAFGQANFSIGQSVIQSEFYNAILEAVSMTGSILSLFIGTAAGPTLTVDIPIAFNALAGFDVSRIVVNES